MSFWVKPNRGYERTCQSNRGRHRRGPRNRPRIALKLAASGADVVAVDLQTEFCAETVQQVQARAGQPGPSAQKCGRGRQHERGGGTDSQSPRAC